MDFTNSLITHLQTIGVLGYGLVFLATFLESVVLVGSFIPGVVVVILSGFVSAQGYLDIGDLIIYTSVGAVLGDLVSYYLGTKGTRLFRQENRLLKTAHLDKAKAFFAKHGNKSLLLGKFLGPVRPIVSFVAGLSHMPPRTFLIWDIVSTIVWATAYILLGYFFGGALSTIQTWSTRVGVVVLVLFATCVVIWFLLKRSRSVFQFIASITSSLFQGLAQNPEIKKITQAHPQFSRWVGRRFSIKTFIGLPLTIFTLTFLYLISLFVGNLSDVLESSNIVEIDVRVANVMTIFQSARLIHAFTWITFLGNWLIIFGFLLGISCLLLIWKRKEFIFPLWVTLAGSELFAAITKWAIHRPRPIAALYAEKSFSFPSGHAAVSFAFYGFLAYILFRLFKKWQWKINSLIFASLVIFLVGFSRLYLGVHYLSDVWEGYIVGALWVILGMALTEWLMWRGGEHRFTPIKKINVAVASSGIIILEIIFFCVFGRTNYPELKLPTSVETPSVIAQQNSISTIFETEHLSKYTETLNGAPMEPLSFIILAKDDTELTSVFTQAGWNVADPVSIGSVGQLALAVTKNQAYPTAPMTPSFWNTQPHDFGFERMTKENSARERHHVRVWKTNILVESGQHVYVGTASFDVGVKWAITHTIQPNIDTERELVLASLNSTGRITTTQIIPLVPPVLGKNFSGDPFFTDGNAYVITVQ